MRADLQRVFLQHDRRELELRAALVDALRVFHFARLPDPGCEATALGAVALGLVNPLLAVIPLIDPGPGKDSDCGRLLASGKAPASPEQKKPQRETETR